MPSRRRAGNARSSRRFKITPSRYSYGNSPSIVRLRQASMCR
jgi:hypothetical protein